MALNRARLATWFPFLGWPRPDRATLRGEIMAGLTVAMLVLPQGVAYAALAGMPLVTGIYASFIPALVGVLFSASARLSVGPTALTSLLIGASLGPLAVPGGADWVSLAVWLALMSGVLQLLMGAMRFGWLLKLVNSPVLIGFTQGASVLIALSQLPALLGFTGRPMAQWLSGPPPDWTAMAFGFCTMAILWTAKQRWPRLPAAMLVVGLGAIVSAALGYALRGGAVIGTLPTGLPAPYLPAAISLHTFGALLLPALMITMVSFLETASSAKVDNSRSGKLWNENQDLIGQGLAKIASGLCGAFATSSSFSRSAINLYAGAKTGWATIVCVVLIGVALLWLMPLLYHVPQAVLAGLVVTAILGLVRPAAFVALWRVSRIEAGTAMATFALTIATAPAIYWGVLAGLAMSLSHYMYRHLHPRIIEVGLHPDGRLRDRHLWHLPPLREDVCALRMDAELDFASASTLERAVSEQLAAHPSIGTLCLFAQPINRIDITGAEVFGSIRQSIESRGLSLWVIGLKMPAQTVLEKAGLLTPGPMLRVFGTDAEALAALAEPTTPSTEA
ncbi:SulP family inorganic anion transporter [Variovorax sp. LT1R16]|uniref:SulP family inorganic anion transporter n=1 Tax=Variovorax sp. LT1R16 TaxID=3443728 RepID=UPI003F472F3C